MTDSGDPLQEFTCLVENKKKENREQYNLLPNFDGSDRQKSHFRRFLRAKHGNATKALCKLQNYHQWYEEFELKSSLQELQTGKLLLMNHDKRNRPVVLVKVALHVSGADEEAEIMNLVARVCFYMVHHARDGAVLIVDLQSFGSGNVQISLPRAIGTMVTKFFPEYVQGLFFINVPYLAMTAWRWIKPIVPKKHLERIAFLDEPGDLLEYIESEHLHSSYGGTWTIQDDEWISMTIEALESIEKRPY